MRKDLVLSLQVKCQDVAKIFSNPDRAFNGNKEVFTVFKIIPLSESVALCVYDKLPTGKRAIAVFIYINGGEGYWTYFFPTDSHVLGLRELGTYLHEVEVFNFDKN